MSQPNNTILQLSGEEQPPTTTPYALQQYLTSPSGVTDRLLTDFSVSQVVGRVQTLGDEARRLGNIISQPAQPIQPVQPAQPAQNTS